MVKHASCVRCQPVTLQSGMDGVPPNAGQLPSAMISVEQSILNDDDSSVCGVVFITSEGGVRNPKLSQTSKLSQQQNAEPYKPTWTEQKSRKISNKSLLILTLGLAVLLGISIGIAVGVARQRHASQQQQQGQQAQPGARASGAVLTTLPFTILARVAPPSGAAGYSCDAVFATDKVIQQAVSQLQSAYTTELAPFVIDSINVTKLSCNGVSYTVQHLAQWDIWPMSAAPTAATAAGVQLQESGSSSGIASGFLELAIDLEMYKHLYVEDIEVHPEDSWMYEARQQAAAATAIILPRLLHDVFQVTVTAGSLQVLQLPTITITSCAAVNATVSATSARAPAFEVTRTRTDAVTGVVLDTQTITIAEPMHNAQDNTGGSSSPAPISGDSGGGSSSSSSSSNSNTDITATSAPSSATSSNSSSSSAGGGGGEGVVDSDTATSGSSNVSSGGQGIPSGPQLPQVKQPGPAAAAQTCRIGVNCVLPNALSTCIGNTCAVYTCLPGWQDCDGLASNGCEADALKFFSDSSHCGGCGKICLAPLTCINGRCALPAAQEPPTTALKPIDQDPTPPPTARPKPQKPQDQQKPTNGSSTEPEPTSEQPQPELPSDEAVLPGTPAVPPPATAAKPPSAVEPQQPAATGSEQPPGAAPAVPKPVSPVKPQPPVKVMPTLYDDVWRIVPAQTTISLDVLANDHLGGNDAKDVTISIVAPPAAGSASVLPAAVVMPATAGSTTAGSTTARSAGSTAGRQTIMYIQPSSNPLAAGQEITLYYTVNVPGQPAPAPAAVTIIGAMANPVPSLMDCGPSTKEVPGTVLLHRADDKTAAVKLPFAISLYGNTYTTATVSSNGWISFGESGAKEVCNMDTSWPAGECLGKGPVLAVFWDDLLPDSVLSYHDKQLGAYIIQWTNVMSPSSPILMGTFQAYLFHNGSIGYVYRDLIGTDQALGSSAVIGIRGPTTNDRQVQRQLEHSDPHGTWFYALGVNDVDYVTTISAQRRSLNPGLALISYPQNSSTVSSTSRHSAGSTVPGKFQFWVTDAVESSLARSLVAPGSPARPTLDKPIAVAASNSSSSSNGGVVTLSWTISPGLPRVQQYRLFVAADPTFSQLLRQPAGDAFSPDDIPGSTRSVDVVLGSGFAGGEISVLLLACTDMVCRASCVQQFPRNSTPQSLISARTR